MARKPLATGQIVLITGASSAFGTALAHRFARGGYHLAIVARSASELKVLVAALSTEHGVKLCRRPVAHRDKYARRHAVRQREAE
jgi:short-subunit dehydrogenase